MSLCNDADIVGCVAKTYGRDVRFGYQTDEFSVCIDDAAVRVIFPVHRLQRFENRGLRGNVRQRVKFDFLQRNPGVFKEHRFLEMKTLQQIAGLGVQGAETAGNRAYAERALVERVGNRGCHRVCVRVQMACYVDSI